MSELLVRYTERVSRGDAEYAAQACGTTAADGLWEGWIEFQDGDGFAIRTPRETEQTNRDALMYWAEGLSAAYLEGALQRALDAVENPRETRIVAATALFEAPAPNRRPASHEMRRPVLDPFATYAQGEDLLRRQLAALSRDHLVALIRSYGLPVNCDVTIAKSELVHGIVRAVHDSPVV